MTTISYLLEEWADEPEDGQKANEWPYPTTHARFRILGDLAERTTERTGKTGDVSIVENVISSGWSEYTQDDEYEFEVYVGTELVYTAGTGYPEYNRNNNDLAGTTFAAFQHWLNEVT